MHASYGTGRIVDQVRFALSGHTRGESAIFCAIIVVVLWCCRFAQAFTQQAMNSKRLSRVCEWTPAGLDFDTVINV
jgi:hypothetical protein